MRIPLWTDRIRTCGMMAPKAIVLPLDDGPIYHKETLLFRRAGFYMTRIILIQNFVLELSPEFWANRMRNILVLAVSSLSARHCNK